MDKKNFIFLFTMLISFFLINQWFSSKHQEQLLKDAQNGVSFATSAKESTISFHIDPNQLPYSKYYDLENSQAAVGDGLVFDQNFLTINKTDALKEIVLKEGKKDINMKLIFQSDDGLCLYGQNLDSSLVTAFLPQLKKMSVVLAPITSGTKDLVYGSYQNQKVQLQGPVKDDAIVLVKSENVIAPIGVYFVKNKKFELFAAYDHLRDFLTFKSFEMPTTSKEQFYVLENDFQQIVFSNLGGSIAEINLRLKSENNSSVVLPIQYDKIIDKKFPYEASFPLNKSLVLNAANQIVPAQTKVGGYYPLLRRDLADKSGKVPQELQSRFYALNLISSDKTADQSSYKLVRYEKDLIEFEGYLKGKKIVKTYKLPKDDKAPYTLLLTVKTDGENSNLFLSTGVPEVELVGNRYNPLLQYAEEKKSQYLVEKVKLPKESVLDNEQLVSYVANSNGYFGLMLSSLEQQVKGYATSLIPGSLIPTRLSLIDAEENRFPAKNYPGYEMLLPLSLNQKSQSFAFFFGPLEKSVLEKADMAFAAIYKNPGFESALTFYGFFALISEPFSKFMFLVLQFFHFITGSWGVSLILMTLTFRIILYPMTSWSSKISLRSQELQPKLALLDEKYKKDPSRLLSERMKLMREHKINPFAPFFPVLIQFPIFIGMADLLNSTFQLRGASFIPGWIDNLSEPDVLFSWNIYIPLIGYSFHLLPILVGLIMYFQMNMSSPKIKVEEMTEQQRQQKTILSVFTLGFPIMIYNMASGFNIYWFFSTLFGIIQQKLTNKKVL